MSWMFCAVLNDTWQTRVCYQYLSLLISAAIGDWRRQLTSDVANYHRTRFTIVDLCHPGFVVVYRDSFRCRETIACRVEHEVTIKAWIQFFLVWDSGRLGFAAKISVAELPARLKSIYQMLYKRNCTGCGLDWFAALELQDFEIKCIDDI